MSNEGDRDRGPRMGSILPAIVYRMGKPLSCLLVTSEQHRARIRSANIPRDIGEPLCTVNTVNIHY